jgi:hypothetical protein
VGIQLVRNEQEEICKFKKGNGNLQVSALPRSLEITMSLGARNANGRGNEQENLATIPRGGHDG